MSERKWTKGPWVAEVVEGNSGGWRSMEQSIVIQSGETLIASYVTSYCEYPETNAESAANARLIAAAPDLYDALLLTTRYITAVESFLGQGLEVEGWHMNGDKELFDNFFTENRGDFDLAKARAALQRAEGEL